MFTLQWLAQPMCRLLTLTLLHFIWQGLALCLALALLVELCKLHRPTTRYACSLAALLAMTILPPATLLWLALRRHGEGVDRSAFDIISPAHVASGWAANLHRLEIVQPYVLAIWLAGVALFGSRLLTGAVGVVRLRRGRLPLPQKVTAIV